MYHAPAEVASKRKNTVEAQKHLLIRVYVNSICLREVLTGSENQ